MGVVRWLKNRGTWAVIKRPIKSWLTEDGMDFLKGSKTKLGALGAFLAAIAAVLTQVAGLDFDAMTKLEAAKAVLGILQEGFLALGGYGAVMKLVRWWEARQEPED